ncbi:germinal-center associated nuclear protein isoform X1 [Hylaeus anthracinus]|uniref:germinal-center associated nuclear protein isoform X1 n=2 Tax=Hylaeus anthracinus TaxID=313031 RepID=UPI0023BA39D9|nr:germinal-center associated nuclear protein isoform X1 [Hylaeus anthracinus]
MTDIIKGTCLSMCPEKECWIREKEGLLHIFEIDESVKTANSKRPKADPTKVVKCFSRPAAGVNMTDPDQLRPAPVLLSTIRYLFTKIATRTDVDWVVVYDFIFDRLRSVRQDAGIQRIDVLTSIQIFEPIVRFLVYSAQRLCDRSISEFNPKINNQHLTECITSLLVLYDKKEQNDKPDSLDLDRCMQKLSLNDNRQEMEALYILLNMGNTETLKRALSLSSDLRRNSNIQLSMKISFAWYLKNYVRVCSLIQQLSPLLIFAAMINIQIIRRTALKIMSSGYNSKVFTFPGLKLQKVLLYKDIEKIRADCELFGLVFTDQNILFQKANFKDEVQLSNPEMYYYTYQSLHNFLPDILLMSM